VDGGSLPNRIHEEQTDGRCADLEGRARPSQGNRGGGSPPGSLDRDRAFGRFEMLASGQAPSLQPPDRAQAGLLTRVH